MRQTTKPLKFIGILIFFVFFLSILAYYIRYTNTSIHMTTVIEEVNVQAFDWLFKWQTKGDAVNYPQTDQHYEISFSKDQISFVNDHSKIYTGSSILENSQEQAYPDYKGQVFSKDFYGGLAKIWFEEQTLQNIFKENKHDFIKVLDDYAVHDARQISIELTINDLQNVLTKWLDILDTYHESEVFADVIQEDILKDFSMKAVYEAYIDQFFDKIYLRYHKTSPVEIRIYTDHKSITGFLFNLQLKYLDCDAYEQITLTGQ